MIEGVIFDMDGVLVDSEQYICAAAMKYFEERGVEVSPEDFEPFVGAGENRYIGGVAQMYDVPIDIDQAKDRVYSIYAELVHGKLDPLAGVHAFIDRCRQRGLKLALATSADRVKMEVNLREIGLPVETFDAAVNGLDVKHKKPDPEIFLTAARQMNVPPERCLVVEDAVNGVAAAKSAGARCLGLTTSFDAGQLGEADWHAPDLSAAPEACLDW